MNLARREEGFIAGFVGKGRGTIARLAALLTLLEWSASADPTPPTTISKSALTGATRLWEEFFSSPCSSCFSCRWPQPARTTAAQSRPLPARQAASHGQARDNPGQSTRAHVRRARCRPDLARPGAPGPDPPSTPNDCWARPANGRMGGQSEHIRLTASARITGNAGN